MVSQLNYGLKKTIILHTNDRLHTCTNRATVVEIIAANNVEPSTCNKCYLSIAFNKEVTSACISHFQKFETENRPHIFIGK